MYELAILEQHAGNNDEALTLLREAIDHGLSPDESLGIETDPDRKSLQSDSPIHRARRRNQKARCCSRSED